MINAIGDVAMQQTIRAYYNSANHEQAVVEHKDDQVREKRKVEKSKDGSKPELNLHNEENEKSKNIVENDGQVIVEKYTEDGRLIRKIPPGYLPVGEMA
jgi:hypothetical protein